MGHFLATGHGRAPGTGLEALEHRTVFDDRAFYRQRIRREVVVVLRVGDRALERLCDELRGLPRNEHEIIDGIRSFATLDCAGDFAHLFRGHARVASEGLNFHVVGKDSVFK